MRLAALLLALVTLTHYGYSPLAEGHEDAARAARAWFYVLRGLEGVILFGLVGILARRPLVWLVCLWGALEEGETAVCRLAIGIGNAPGYAPFQGLCGPGWYIFGALVAAAIALNLHDNKRSGE